MPTIVRVLFAVVALNLGAPARAVEYQPPVDAPVVDPFRAPTTRYGAGNRGIDYQTTPGDAVRAAAEGVVTFAGRVGNGLHVVVRHDDGVRTTYAFVQAIDVRRNQHVERGQQVATSAARLHFGARIGDVYIDPAQLFGGGDSAAHAYLVDDDEAKESSAEERRHLIDLVRGVLPPPSPSEVDQWERDNADCTPADQPTPLKPSTRRIAMLVGGLGSATGSAAILGVDTASLGYAVADVHQFSYRAGGGAYGPRDTQQDIAISAERLAGQITKLHEANPGVPIDVIAHSQGGLVTRAALTGERGLPGVATVVTLGTPHLGNTLAAAGDAIGATRGAGAQVMVGAAAVAGGIDPTSVSVRQLAKGSAFLRGLARQPSPPTYVHVVAVAASSDPVVPAVDARWNGEGIANTVVDLAGPPDAAGHSRLPGDPAATREIALAIVGRRPTCIPLDEWQRRRVGSTAASTAQRTTAEAAERAAQWLDERIPAGGPTMTRR